MNNDTKNNKLIPSQSELETLLQYFHNKQYDLAEKTALILSKKFPNHPFSWTVLGAVFNLLERMMRLNALLGMNSLSIMTVI